jgi:hypothetical protein
MWGCFVCPKAIEGLAQEPGTLSGLIVVNIGCRRLAYYSGSNNRYFRPNNL